MYHQFSYWDNVGGEVLEAALDNAKSGARFLVRLSIIILLDEIVTLTCGKECGMASGMLDHYG